MKALILGVATAALLAASIDAQAMQDRPDARPAPAPRPAPVARPAPAPRPEGGGGFRGGGARPGAPAPGAPQARPDFGGHGLGGRPDFGARVAPTVSGAQPSLAGRPDGVRRFGGQGGDGRGFQGRRFDGQGFPGRGPGATPQIGATPPASGAGVPGGSTRGDREGDRRGFRADPGRPDAGQRFDGQRFDGQRFDGQGFDGRRFDRNGDGRVDQGDRRAGGGERFGNGRGGYGGFDRNGGRDGRYDRAGGGRAFTYNGSRHNAFRVRPYVFPRGYAYRRYGRGYRLPYALLAPSYFLYDYSSFYLSAPPSDVYRWIRYGPDALLVDTRTGEVIDTAYGVFYDGEAYGGAAYGDEDGYDPGYDSGGYPDGPPPDGYGDDPR